MTTQGAAQAIVGGLGLTPTALRIALLRAWIACEKPAGQPWQWNNPLNTTQPGYGSTSTGNAKGVRVYPTPAEGVAAIVATLRSGNYPKILAGLTQAHAALFFNSASEWGRWGTDRACVQRVYGSGPANRATVPPVSSVGPVIPPVIPPVLALAVVALVGLWVIE